MISEMADGPVSQMTQAQFRGSKGNAPLFLRVREHPEFGRTTDMRWRIQRQITCEIRV